MKPSKSNAFQRIESGLSRITRADPSDPIASMYAALSETEFGWSLQLEPMRAIDALKPWARLATSHDAFTLLCGEPTHSGDGAGTLAALAARLDVPVMEQFDPQYLVVDELALRDLLVLSSMNDLLAVLIAGPIEAADARAIAAASAAGRSALRAQLRAVAALKVGGVRTVGLVTRQRDQAALFVAENFRHYLAALRDCPASEIAPPEPELIHRLLDRTGRLTVRPIETSAFSTWLDVGVSTASNGEVRPADASLVYDIPGDSWHGE